MSSYQSIQNRSDAPGFFWTPADQIDDERLCLIGMEARHAKTVCRIATGDMITVCDGEGNAYDCEVVSATPKKIVGAIVRSHRQLGEPIARVTLAVGVGRPALFDWIVEKSVELGVAGIIPIRAARSPSGIGGSEASRRRVERWRRLSLGAMKQSLRSVRPAIDEITTPEDLALQIPQYQCAWLADPDGDRLTEHEQEHPGAVRALVLIGPEAGWTSGERAVFIDTGVQLLSLGSRRLRAETAAVTALTLILHHLGEI